MARLFQVTEAIEMILATKVDPETGEITDETFEALGELEMQRDELALEIATYLKGEAAEAKMVREQAQILMERARRHEKRADGLKRYVMGNLPTGTKLSNSTTQITWRKSEATEILEEDKLPPVTEAPNLWRVKQTPDLREIGARLKLGEEIPGARLVARHNMQIK